jgi:hypothetical protein
MIREAKLVATEMLRHWLLWLYFEGQHWMEKCKETERAASDVWGAKAAVLHCSAFGCTGKSKWL